MKKKSKFSVNKFSQIWQNLLKINHRENLFPQGIPRQKKLLKRVY